LAFCGFSLHTTAICIWWFLTLKTFITSPAATQCFSALNQNRTRRNQMDEQEKEIEEILRTFDKAPSPSSENSVQNQAQQNNKQPRQISQKPTDTERTARTSNQTEYKRQAQSSKMDIWFENK
jgi:hypothetical protein